MASQPLRLYLCGVIVSSNATPNRDTALQDLRAPSYLYAFLMDPRIRDNDW